MAVTLHSILPGIAAAVGAVSVLAAVFYWRFVPTPNPPPTSADYGDSENWLYRPGGADRFRGDLAATAIAADGTTIPLSAPPSGNPAIDCFYVYPTVSRDRTANARLILTDEVAEVAWMQFARFQSVCRAFAPLYRQVTRRSLIANAMRLGTYGDYELAYRDVRDAWRDYLAHDNQGRGFVLFGHSQGSWMLQRLMKEEIEGTPVQGLLVSALLIGGSVTVREGNVTGGDFDSIPLCRAPGQTGCLVAYSTFRANWPPPAHSRYGSDPGNGLVAACTNPAALSGGKAVLDAVLPARLVPRGTAGAKPAVPTATPFVTLPGLISGECVHDSHGTYLAISFNGKPSDRRRNDIKGDTLVLGKVLRGWGLHMLDVNLALGDLVRLVETQAAAFVQAQAGQRDR